MNLLNLDYPAWLRELEAELPDVPTDITILGRKIDQTSVREWRAAFHWTENQLLSLLQRATHFKDEEVDKAARHWQWVCVAAFVSGAITEALLAAIL